jgi:two-component system sensor histidine kinase/response regulator
MQTRTYIDSEEQHPFDETEVRARVAASRVEVEAGRDSHAVMLRAVIANSLSLTYIKDLLGRYLLANEAFERSFGVREADLLGQPDDYVDTVLPPAWQANDQRAQQRAVRVEEYFDAPDGRHIYESVKFPLYNADGELYGTCSVSLDVTEVRQVMRAAEEARDEAKLAAELALAEALGQSEVKSQFMATMSHEIRTPMNGVIGLASLLMGTDLDAGQRRYADGIHAAGKSLLAVINDILDFSKIEAGKLVLDSDDFDLSAVLTDVAALVDPGSQDNVTVITRRGPKLPTRVRGDGGRLRQILLNLAGNAVKFTTRGSVTVRADPVAGLAGDTDTILVRFEITDTGIGIAPADAERLFEPFTQADASTTRTHGGTGLGLAICRQLTEAMGGTIGVDSEPGQGSTFWCLIPFGRARNLDPAAGPSLAPDVTGLRVLVVDAPAGQALLQASLRTWKISSTAAGSTAVALGALRGAAERGRPFDVAIIDADVSGVDSADLVRQITGDPDIPTVHIVMLNHGGPTGPDATLTDGVGAYLAKPVHQSQLYECLTRTAAPLIPVLVPPRHGEPAAATATPSRDRGRILLVEDNEINQMVAVGLLDSLGYQPDVARDGIEAIDMAAATDYDAVLMDCRMPRMDGFTATAELRRLEGGGRHTPIIAMTASALVADRVRCLAAGMDDYLAKPVNPTELESTLDVWINGTHRDAEAHARPDTEPIAEPVAPGGDPITRRLDELRGDKTEPERALVNRLVASFLALVPGYLTSLGNAVTAADAAAVEEQAHSLKGAAANIGALGVAETCQRLEDLGHTGSLEPGTDDDLRCLQAEISDIDTQLRSILARDHPA